MKVKIFIIFAAFLMLINSKSAKSQNIDEGIFLNGQADKIDIEIEFDSKNFALYVMIYNRNDCAIILDTNVIHTHVSYNSDVNKISFSYSNHPDRIPQDDKFSYFSLIQIPKDSILKYKIFYTNFDKILPSSKVPYLSYSLCYVKETDFPGVPLNDLIKKDYGEWVLLSKNFILLERNL